MTILIEQQEVTSWPQQEGEEINREQHSQQITNELVLDGGFPLPKPLSQPGFMAPHINSYGHSFRSLLTSYYSTF